MCYAAAQGLDLKWSTGALKSCRAESNVAILEQVLSHCTLQALVDAHVLLTRRLVGKAASFHASMLWPVNPPDTAEICLGAYLSDIGIPLEAKRLDKATCHVVPCYIRVGRQVCIVVADRACHLAKVLYPGNLQRP